MKAHIGVDAKSRLVHTVKTTMAKVHDARLTDDLICPDDRVIFGDKGYVSHKRKRAARGNGILWAVKDKRKEVAPCRRRRTHATENMGSFESRSSTSSALSNASSAIARCVIVGCSKIRRKCSA
jgi:IS5 family transposase